MTLQINRVSVQAELLDYHLEDESDIRSRLQQQLTRVLDNLDLPEFHRDSFNEETNEKLNKEPTDELNNESNKDILIPQIEINFPDRADIDVFDDQALYSWLFEEISCQLNRVLSANTGSTTAFIDGETRDVFPTGDASSSYEVWEQITQAIERQQGSLVAVKNGQRSIQVEKMLPLLMQQLSRNERHHKMVRDWLQNPVFRGRLIRLMGKQPAIVSDFIRLVFKEPLPDAFARFFGEIQNDHGPGVWNKALDAVIQCALVNRHQNSLKVRWKIIYELFALIEKTEPEQSIVSSIVASFSRISVVSEEKSEQLLRWLNVTRLQRRVKSASVHRQLEALFMKQSKSGHPSTAQGLNTVPSRGRDELLIQGTLHSSSLLNQYRLLQKLQGMVLSLTDKQQDLDSIIRILEEVFWTVEGVQNMEVSISQQIIQWLKQVTRRIESNNYGIEPGKLTELIRQYQYVFISKKAVPIEVKQTLFDSIGRLSHSAFLPLGIRDEIDSWLGEINRQEYPMLLLENWFIWIYQHWPLNTQAGKLNTLLFDRIPKLQKPEWIKYHRESSKSASETSKSAHSISKETGNTDAANHVEFGQEMVAFRHDLIALLEAYLDRPSQVTESHVRRTFSLYSAIFSVEIGLKIREFTSNPSNQVGRHLLESLSKNVEWFIEPVATSEGQIIDTLFHEEIKALQTLLQVQDKMSVLILNTKISSSVSNGLGHSVRRKYVSQSLINQRFNTPVVLMKQLLEFCHSTLQIWLYAPEYRQIIDVMVAPTLESFQQLLRKAEKSSPTLLSHLPWWWSSVYFWSELVCKSDHLAEETINVLRRRLKEIEGFISNSSLGVKQVTKANAGLLQRETSFLKSESFSEGELIPEINESLLPVQLEEQSGAILPMNNSSLSAMPSDVPHSDNSDKEDAVAEGVIQNDVNQSGSSSLEPVNPMYSSNAYQAVDNMLGESAERKVGEVTSTGNSLINNSGTAEMPSNFLHSDNSVQEDAAADMVTDGVIQNDVIQSGSSSLEPINHMHSSDAYQAAVNLSGESEKRQVEEIASGVSLTSESVVTSETKQDDATSISAMDTILQKKPRAPISSDTEHSVSLKVSESELGALPRQPELENRKSSSVILDYFNQHLPSEGIRSENTDKHNEQTHVEQEKIQQSKIIEQTRKAISANLGKEHISDASVWNQCQQDFRHKKQKLKGLISSIQPKGLANQIANAKAALREKIQLQSEDLISFEAGIVLLWPYFQSLFSRCNLLDEDAQFADEQSQFKAHALLCKIMQVEPDQDCYRVINVLLGFAYDLQVESVIELSEEEQGEVEKLITSAIAHWPAVAGLTSDGMRDLFLQRQGSIQLSEHGYQVSVESKSQDILLTKLPWGLGTVTLPWLGESLIQINWQYGW